MDIIQISNEIQNKILKLSEGRKLIKQRAEEKSNYIGEYDRKMAITIMRLKNGEKFSIDNVDIGGDSLPGNLIEKLAKGICYKEKIDMEKAEGLYKSAVSGMRSLETEMSGLQSIFRYLQDV